MVDRARIWCHDGRWALLATLRIGVDDGVGAARGQEERLAMRADDQAANSHAVSFLNCPRCGLSIRPKTRWLAAEHCSRCLARARVAVRMFSSRLPAAELYREGQAPQARAPGTFPEQTGAVRDEDRAACRSERGDESLVLAHPARALCRHRHRAVAGCGARAAVDPGAAAWLRRDRGGGGSAVRGAGARGHEVTLFAAPGSRSAARVCALLEAAHANEIGASLFESDHVACAWGRIELAAERGLPFDVVHDHSGFTALAMADRVDVPVVHTIHGSLDPRRRRSISATGTRRRWWRSAARRRTARRWRPDRHVVPNPIAVDRWPLREQKQDYLLWAGRMDPVKGAHRAIEAARLGGSDAGARGAGADWAGAVFPGAVEPHVDGRRVHYVGEVAGVGEAGAVRERGGLLMPVRWREPFGMVMVEALACGTPVIAFPEGAAAEIVIDGENGMLVADEAEHGTRRSHQISARSTLGAAGERRRTLRRGGQRRRLRAGLPRSDRRQPPDRRLAPGPRGNRSREIPVPPVEHKAMSPRSRSRAAASALRGGP